MAENEVYFMAEDERGILIQVVLGLLSVATLYLGINDKIPLLIIAGVTPLAIFSLYW